MMILLFFLLLLIQFSLVGRVCVLVVTVLFRETWPWSAGHTLEARLQGRVTLMFHLVPEVLNLTLLTCGSANSLSWGALWVVEQQPWPLLSRCQ